MNIKTKIEFITDENSHWYKSLRKKDVYYPSVTTILSVFPKNVGFNKYLTAQVSWESSQEILKAAGRRGQNVHRGTERLEEGETLYRENFTLEEWMMLIGFVTWWKEYQPKLIKKEYSVVSDKLKTGGTIDRIYEIRGQNVLLDIKTSSSIYENYWIQTAAYVKLLGKKDPKIDLTAILRLAPRKKCGYEYCVRDQEQFEEDYKIFEATKKTWDYLNPDAKPKLLEVPATLCLKNTNQKN